tara:strand:- start:204 stop:512 length:309 start_codon:yes stop_codon:yes gene_type:complete
MVLTKLKGVGYNQSKGGFNARAGFGQFTKRAVAPHDDPTNLQAAVKEQNKQRTDDTPDNQVVVGDILMESGKKMKTVFKREKVSDLPREKVGYQENSSFKKL